MYLAHEANKSHEDSKTQDEMQINLKLIVAYPKSEYFYLCFMQIYELAWIKV